MARFWVAQVNVLSQCNSCDDTYMGTLFFYPWPFSICTNSKPNINVSIFNFNWDCKLALLNILRPEQNGRNFISRIVKCIFLLLFFVAFCFNLIYISPKRVANGPVLTTYNVRLDIQHFNSRCATSRPVAPSNLQTWFNFNPNMDK